MFSLIKSICFSLRTAILFTLLSLSLVSWATAVETRNAVTAGEYCQFLNEVASTDDQGLFDEKIALETLVTRSGAPGNYTYQVSSEDQAKSIVYINACAAMRYCNWLQDACFPSFNDPWSYNIDPQLQSNSSTFCVLYELPTTIHKNSGKESHKTPWKIAEEGLTLGLAVLLTEEESGLMPEQIQERENDLSNRVPLNERRSLTTYREETPQARNTSHQTTGENIVSLQTQANSTQKHEEIVAYLNLLARDANQANALAASTTGETAVIRWNESIQAHRSLFLEHKKYIEWLQKKLQQAPEHLKKDWREQLEAADYKKYVLFCRVSAMEVNQAGSIASMCSKTTDVKRTWEKSIDKRKWKPFIDATQALIDAQNLYIQALTLSLEHSPEKFKNIWTKQLQEANNKKALLACSIPGLEVDMAYAKDAHADHVATQKQGEEAVRLWHESIQAAEALVAALDKYIQSLQYFQKGIPNQVKNIWAEKLKDAENKKKCFVSNVFAKKANYASALNAVAQDKAFAAEGEEAVAFWDEAIQAAQKLLEAQQHYVQSFKETEECVPEPFKNHWTEQLEEAYCKQELVSCNIFAKEANRLSAMNFILQDKALQAQGEEAAGLWEEGIQVSKKRAEALENYINALQAVLEKSPQTFHTICASYLEEAQNKKELTICSILAKEANKVGSLDDLIQSKAVAANKKEALLFREEAIQSSQAHKTALDKYSDSLKSALKKAPKQFKVIWTEKLKETQDSRPLMTNTTLGDDENCSSSLDDSAQDHKMRLTEKNLTHWNKSKKITEATHDSTIMEPPGSPRTIVNIWSNLSRKNSFSSESTLPIFDHDEYSLDEVTPLPDITIEPPSASPSFTFTVTRDMFNKVLTQATVASKYAPETIDLFCEIHEFLDSKKAIDYKNKLSAACDKIEAAHKAVCFAQKNVENYLKKTDDLSEIQTEVPSLFHNDTTLFIALNVAIDAVKDTAKEALDIAKDAMKGFHDQKEYSMLSSLESIYSPFIASFDPIESPTEFFTNNVLKTTDPSAIKNDLEKSWRYSETTKIYATDLKKTIAPLFNIFNGGEFSDDTDLKDLSDAYDAIEATTMMLTTIENQTKNRCSQLESLSNIETTTAVSSPNDIILLGKQKIAIKMLQEAAEKTISVANRLKNYKWEPATDRILRRIKEIHDQFLLLPQPQ